MAFALVAFRRAAAKFGNVSIYAVFAAYCLTAAALPPSIASWKI
jgi:hypothetical protein